MSFTVFDRFEVRDPDVLDRESRDSLIARRNVLLGLWAASRLGLRDHEAEVYAWAVHLADLEAPGHEDVIKKIAHDFAMQGKIIRDRVIRSQLREMELRAFLQLSLAAISDTRKKSRTARKRSQRSLAARSGSGSPSRAADKRKRRR